MTDTIAGAAGEALQDRYAPDSRCFGCGPANEKGLRIKSRLEGGEVVCDFAPEPHQKVTATCRGTFVAVKEGHPAYHRW